MNNGIRGAATAAIALLLVAPAYAGIGGDVLVDQSTSPDGGNYVASNFAPAFDQFDSEGADDFEVTSADGWTIDSVEIAGTYTNGTGPAATFNVVISESAETDGFNQPGEEVCRYDELVEAPGAGGLVTVFLSLPVACELGPGTHWISVQANMAPGAGVFRWGSQSSMVGDPAVWRNPGEGTPFGCADWTPAFLCGQSSGGGLTFTLFGFESSFFSDDFESGDLLAWSSSKGNVAATAESALEGAFGLEVTVDGTSTKSFVQSSEPGEGGGLASYRFSFLMNANSVDLGANGAVEMVRVFDTNLDALMEMDLLLKSNGTYKLVVSALEDSGDSRLLGQLSVGGADVTDLSIEWVAATADGANDGQLRVIRNGSVQLEATDLDTDSLAVSAVRLGLPKGSADILGAGGTLSFDAFDSVSSVEDS